MSNMTIIKNILSNSIYTYILILQKYSNKKQNKIIERYSDRYSQIKKTDLNKWKPGNFIVTILKYAYIIEIY